MQTPSRRVSSKDVANWFDPRKKQLGSWAFILNRVTAIGLTIYLYMHLVILSKLAQGPVAWDSFIAIVKQPWFVVGEFLVVAGGLLHGLNGLRIILNSFGYGVPSQKQIFIVLMVLAVIASIIFGIRMFTV
jgi:succinate dehydrogenase / fumarate reductase cytochrome b subunit